MNSRITTQFGILFLLLITLVGSACTSSIRIRVLQPADIYLPQNIQRMALVNRYKPQKSDKFLNVLEGLLTGEGIGQDKRGAEASLDGLAYVMAQSPRFEAKRLSLELEGSGRPEFPEPLRPGRVQNLCVQEGVDALVTVEAFDSNSKLDFSVSEKTEKTKEGKEVKVPVHTANARINVTVGWRMYDAKTGQLLDEYRMIDGMNFRGTGRTQSQAQGNLPNKDRILQDIGRRTGDAYARRISPNYINVRRTWYTKAKNNIDMKAGRDLMNGSRWELARERYMQALNDPRPQVARKAAYNLAIVAEVFGELEEAIDWCDKAIQMGDKNAIQYSRSLQYRLRDQDRLRQQMEGN